jgi:hypothetical protein
MTKRISVQPKAGSVNPQSRSAMPWATLSLAGALVTAVGCVTMRPGIGGDEPPTGVADDASSFPGETAEPTTGFGDAAGGIGCAPQAPVPDFGTPVTCGAPPPAISGGTLLVTRDGSKAIASDPDRDLVYVVDLTAMQRRFTVVLKPGDEPGRLAEDGAGRIHVALRGSGTLATIDPSAGTVTARRSVCPAPRGVAWQASTDVVLVACATGELASLPAAGGPATLKVIERDLRDVIVNGDNVAITLFRSAQLVRLASDGSIARTDPMPSTVSPILASHVAWRAVPGPGGEVVAVHQVETTQSVSTKSSGGYGCGGGLLGGAFGGFPDSGPLASDAALATFADGAALETAQGPDSGLVAFVDASTTEAVQGADAAVEASTDPTTTFDDLGAPPIAPPPGFPGLGAPIGSVMTVIDGNGTATTTTPFNGVLPVDVAVSADGATVVAVAAGSGTGIAQVDNLFAFGLGAAGTTPSESERQINGQATAVAFDTSGNVLVQTREPAALWVVRNAQQGLATLTDTDVQSITLSAISKRDTGHDIFHTHAGALIACASCHPEGGDDGHVWLLDNNKRRTPSLRGTIEGTAPYHWPGDEADFSSIVKDVYVVRMSGAALSPTLTGALSAWVNAIPAPPAPTWIDANAAAAGRAIFERADVGCASCHLGSKFTNNATVDVGTGGGFQVPPLVGVGWRTPLMHDGCAATIADRFGSCATAQHGNITSLSPTDTANLTAYLETL